MENLKLIDWGTDKDEILKLIYIPDKTADKLELLIAAVHTIIMC